MVPQTLRILLIIGMICYFILIVHYLKKRMLDLKYTLVWIVLGLFLLLMAIFPDILIFIRRISGIESNMNALYIMLIAFLMLISMTLTAIVSRTSLKIRSMVQEIAMLEKRIRDLENKDEQQ